MTDQKMTEEQLRHETRREFGFSEERDKDKIEKALQLKKDRYTAIQQKKKKQEEIDRLSANPNGDNKEANKPDSSGDKTQLSLKDQYALLGAKVHVDDIDEVVEWAKSKYEGDISKALADTKLKAVLGVNEEERTTNAATNTSKSRKGTGQVSPETLLKNFEEKGELPESDEDMEKLAQARLKARENA